MATEDVRYRESSQFRLWSFSHSQLAAMRENTNAKAVASISERLSSLGATVPPSSIPMDISAPTSTANTPDPEGGGGTPRLPEFLSPADEATMVTFYTAELMRAGAHAEFSDEIIATAATLFRRFYVTNSIMTYPPQEMLVVALFFGCKAEGAFPRITDFLKTFGRERPEEILAGEFLLFRGIRFSIDVKHPFRALRGAVMELRSLGDIEETRIEAAERRAKDILRFSPLITDAYFHYTPSQIMMAALSLADRSLAERLIQATFHHVNVPEISGTNSGADTPNPTTTNTKETNKSEDNKAFIIGSYVRDKVLGTIESCRDMLSKELPERKEHWANRAVYKAQVVPLKKKLNKCHDPDRWNLVELQKVRREQALSSTKKLDGSEDESAALKDDGAVFGSEAKRRKVSGNKKLEDPFGGPL
ncbi:cyclin-like protein [Apodospora peruviana]|uniref:RNA polymerase II holoenzyme cyclin-like subunit n=1 Tax=Apodospora peruviana TaxID=516989 RepID=A0AAE0IJ51_9PEZI|nr:cyclin-like protein [Apodospora peruviana]